MKKRSDALTALVAEIADLDEDLILARAGEEEARVEFTAARQALDSASQQRSAVEVRLAATRDALRIIQERDEISDETVKALVARAAR